VFHDSVLASILHLRRTLQPVTLHEERMIAMRRGKFMLSRRNDTRGSVWTDWSIDSRLLEKQVENRIADMKDDNYDNNMHNVALKNKYNVK
jgi:hypothetical protein